MILLAWGAQIASGALFGAISLYYYGETPDLSAVALTGLAVAGVKRTFQMLVALGVTALTAAAFLRWFS